MLLLMLSEASPGEGLHCRWKPLSEQWLCLDLLAGMQTILGERPSSLQRASVREYPMATVNCLRSIATKMA
jgi:hypothetical protein